MLCNWMLLTIVNETNPGSVCPSVYMLDRKNDTVNMVTTLRLGIMGFYVNTLVRENGILFAIRISCYTRHDFQIVLQYVKSYNNLS